MPNEADGVYEPRGQAAPRVSDMIATIASHAGTGGAPVVSAPDQRVAPVPGGVLYENVDPDQVGALAEAWRTAGARLSQFQDDVASAVTESRGEWQGAAGEMARQFIAGMGLWVGEAGRGASHAGGQAAKHSEALAAA